MGIQYTNFFIGKVDNNRFQLNILNDIANDAIGQLVVENKTYHENNKVPGINNREWTDKEEPKRNTKERTREKYYMKRVK